jgi:negative regulator of flagellin synthesis FlgM
MKITGSPITTPSSVSSCEAAPTQLPTTPGTSLASEGVSQSAGVQQAQAVLQELPEIDQARVAELREALAQGKLPFDAGRLAGLIDRYHGGRS